MPLDNLEEPFEVFDLGGTLLGVFPRGLVHREGLLHRAVHVAVIDVNGALLAQQRSAHKDLCPELWDVSLGEHLAPGETFHAAAARGLAEELGLHNLALTPIGTPVRRHHREPGRHDFEEQMLFCCTCPSGVDVEADTAEVQATRWLSVSELETWVDAQPAAFTPWCRHHLPRLLAAQRLSAGC
ncbi:MAG: NUDIX domain-containing protein [Pseudomonadota bacterium]